MTLNELQIGKTARILKVGGKGALRQHFLDMGVIPGTDVTLVKLAPMGTLWNLEFTDTSLLYAVMMQKRLK